MIDGLWEWKWHLVYTEGVNQRKAVSFNNIIKIGKLDGLPKSLKVFLLDFSKGCIDRDGSQEDFKSY